MGTSATRPTRDRRTRWGMGSRPMSTVPELDEHSHGLWLRMLGGHFPLRPLPSLLSEIDGLCQRILEARGVGHRQGLLIRVASSSDPVARDYDARQRCSIAHRRFPCAGTSLAGCWPSRTDRRGRGKHVLRSTYANKHRLTRRLSLSEWVISACAHQTSFPRPPLPPNWIRGLRTDFRGAR
jgi:hypothetical protein